MVVKDAAKVENLDELISEAAALVAEKLEQWPVEAKPWVLDKGRLQRFLQGSKGNVEKAVEQLIWCVEFRNELAAWHIEPPAVQAELQLGKFYCRSKDPEGHPVLLYRCCRADHTLCQDLRMRALLYCLDHLESRLDQGDYAPDGKWVVILDMHGKAQRGSVSADYFIKVTRTFVKCYPGRLHCLYIVDASSVIRAVWSMVCRSKIVQPETSQKVVFPCRRVVHGRQMVPELVEHVGEDNVEEEYGGNDDFSWDAEQHWNVVDLAPPSCRNSLLKVASEAASTKDETGSTSSGGTSWFSLRTCDEQSRFTDIEAQTLGKSRCHKDMLAFEQQVVDDCLALRNRLVQFDSAAISCGGSTASCSKFTQLREDLDYILQQGVSNHSFKGDSYDDLKHDLSKWRRAAKQRLRYAIALCGVIFLLVLAFPIAFSFAQCDWN